MADCDFPETEHPGFPCNHPDNDDELITDFDRDADLQIFWAGRRWLKVNWWIFRTFTGERLLNGEPYTGPVYYLGTNDTVPYREI